MKLLIHSLRNIAAAHDATRDAAIVTFYHQALPRLTGACEGLLRKQNFSGIEADELALDALHDSLKGLVRQAGAMTSDSKVIAYVLGTARHHLTTHVRQSGGPTRIRIVDADEPCLAAVMDALTPSHVPTGRDAIIQASYWAAKATLTPQQRGMVEGVLEQGQPVDVVALTLGLARRTAYRRLEEGRAALETALTPLIGPVLREKPLIEPRPIRAATPRRMPPVTMSLGPAPLPRR